MPVDVLVDGVFAFIRMDDDAVGDFLAFIRPQGCEG
jgi:hypothetical protein